jgi:hypothetical protein
MGVELGVAGKGVTPRRLVRGVAIYLEDGSTLRLWLLPAVHFGEDGECL